MLLIIVEVDAVLAIVAGGLVALLLGELASAPAEAGR